jgi:hypothetical protein
MDELEKAQVTFNGSYSNRFHVGLFQVTVPFQSVRPSPVPSLVNVDVIGRLSPVSPCPGSNGRNFINFLAADGQTSQWLVLTMAGFGQMSLVPSLMDGIFPSSRRPTCPPLDELIEMVQYTHRQLVE